VKGSLARATPEDLVLYTVAELAGMWRVTRQHIYNLIARRELGSTQVSKGRAKTRIPASEAAAYIARNTTHAKGRA
jgi:excisionase family DNA binding protein